ncbi:hypothetical protein Vafri_1622 [Volvox africanus]|nr:hypothetical protein Vafri_1622 [Volvox africanus]
MTEWATKSVDHLLDLDAVISSQLCVHAELRVEDFVRHELAAMDASHDFAHIQRVRANARSLSAMEGLDAEATALVDLAALLHDVRDWKYSGSDDATTRAVTVRARWLW